MNLKLMRLIDEQFWETPYYGDRQMRRGFLYLVAIMDWHSRKVLSYRLSNTLDSEFCIEALKEAITRYGRPDIFNSDQGSQFSSLEFTETLKDADVRISTDGKGRWMDNVMIERLWRSSKYECVYLNAFETGSEATKGIDRWIKHYNEERPHSSLDDRTPYKGSLIFIKPLFLQHTARRQLLFLPREDVRVNAFFAIAAVIRHSQHTQQNT